MMSTKVTLSRFSFRKLTSWSKCFGLPIAMAISRAAPAVRGLVVAVSVDGEDRTAAVVAPERLFGEHRLDLGLQRLRVERLDDVVVDAGFLRRDHIFGLRLRGHHDEGGLGEGRVRTDLLEQLVAGHRLHVPVRDHEAVALPSHLAERRGAVRRVVNVLESDLLEQIADDADHRVVVVHHEDRHRKIDSHVLLLRYTSLRSAFGAPVLVIAWTWRMAMPHRPVVTGHLPTGRKITAAIEHPVNRRRTAVPCSGRIGCAIEQSNCASAGRRSWSRLNASSTSPPWPCRPRPPSIRACCAPSISRICGSACARP